MNAIFVNMVGEKGIEFLSNVAMPTTPFAPDINPEECLSDLELLACGRRLLDRLLDVQPFNLLIHVDIMFYPRLRHWQLVLMLLQAFQLRNITPQLHVVDTLMGEKIIDMSNSFAEANDWAQTQERLMMSQARVDYPLTATEFAY